MKKTCAAVLAISMAILWAGGCQEEQASSGEKMARLTAVENRDLKAQLRQETKKQDEEIKNLNSQIQKRDEEIKNLEKQFQTEKEKLNADVDNFSKRLAECEQEKQAVADKAEKDIKNLSGEYSEGILAPILNEKQELEAEVTRLKKALSDCEKKK